MPTGIGEIIIRGYCRNKEYAIHLALKVELSTYIDFLEKDAFLIAIV